MKSPLVATLLWLALCLSAQAQPQCPSTPATGTSNTMCASTAFVTKGITLGGLTIGQAVIAAGNGHGFLYDNAGVVGEIGAVVGGNVGFGTETSPQAPFVLSKNVTSGITPPPGTSAYIVGADGTAVNLVLDVFQNSGTPTPALIFRSADGTAASPSGTGAAKSIGIFGARSYTSAGAYTAATTASIVFNSFNTQTSTDTSSFISFNTTPAAAVAKAEAVRIQASGGLGIGTTADPGIGTAILKKQAFSALTACSGTIEGAMASITDSTTATWGAAITGGSTNHVLGYCDGTNWTVAGK